MERLGLGKGPWISAIVEEQVRWQLMHPTQGVEECVAYLASYIGRHPELLTIGAGKQKR